MWGDVLGSTLRDPLVRVAAAWFVVRMIHGLAIALMGHDLSEPLATATNLIDATIYIATGMKMTWRILME